MVFNSNANTVVAAYSNAQCQDAVNHFSSEVVKSKSVQPHFVSADLNIAPDPTYVAPKGTPMQHFVPANASITHAVVICAVHAHTPDVLSELPTHANAFHANNFRAPMYFNSFPQHCMPYMHCILHTTVKLMHCLQMLPRLPLIYLPFIFMEKIISFLLT